MLLATFLLLFASSRAPAHVDVKFLGSAPVGPLAQVTRGAPKTPDAGACRSWAPLGSRWLELDAVGQIAGEATVARREYYDVSRCDELTMHRLRGRAGAGIYVDARSAYRPPVAAPDHPDAASLAALQRIAGGGPSLFFEWGSARERWAIVGGASLRVCAWRGGRWSVVHEEKSARLRYQPLAVTDMDGDGRPEIVFHEVEGGGEYYGDATLSARAGGAWARIDAGIYGSTA